MPTPETVLGIGARHCADDHWDKGRLRSSRALSP